MTNASHPDDETGLARLLAILVHAGDRCGATREYERFARRLRREYGFEPTRETAAILHSGVAELLP